MSQTNACICECKTYRTYLTASQYLWHQCMSMWMHVHGIKIKKPKINPNLNMWKATNNKHKIRTNTYKKESNIGISCEISKENKEKNWIKVSGQQYAHKCRGPRVWAICIRSYLWPVCACCARMHRCTMHACLGLLKNSSTETK